MKIVFGRFRRSLLLGLVIAGGGLFWLLASGSAADADDWGLITNDPSPWSIQTVQAQYDARQDQVITLEAAVCRDDGFLDFCGDGILSPGSVSLNGPGAIEVQWDMESDGIVNYTDNHGGSGWTS
ncbi:MAG: hypothetical protein DYH08_04805, partial [Actinobacteria bacterium ATB1]|nr:hypothetical protein [Actinobacteria bacterium ATB1]